MYILRITWCHWTCMSVLIKPLSQAPKGTENRSAQYCGLRTEALDTDCVLFGT